MTAAALALVPEPAKRAAVYCRLSLNRDGTAESIADQEAEGRELCDRRGFDVVEVLTDDDLSAYSGAKREGYDRLVALVQRGAVDVVVARRQDRFQRSSIGWGQFLQSCQRQHVLIATVQEGDVDLDSPEGTFMAQIVGNMAELESARIGRRMKAKHMSNAKKGRAHGGVRPFGHARAKDVKDRRTELGLPDVKLDSGELVVVPAEAAMIVEACDLILRGWSLMAVVRKWNDDGIATAKGKDKGTDSVWRPSTLSKVLRSPRIAGRRDAGGELVEAQWDPILPYDRWDLLRRRIEHAPVGRRPNVNLLAGICICAHSPSTCPDPNCKWCPGRPPTDVCGAKMMVFTERGPVQKGIACNSTHRDGCGSNSIVYAKVEPIVVAYVKRWMAATNIHQARSRYTLDVGRELQAEVAKDQQLLDDWTAVAERDRMGPAEYLDITETIRSRLAESQRKLDVLAQDSDLGDADFANVSPETFDELQLETKKRVLRVYVDRVLINKGKRGRRFDGRRVQVIPTKVVSAVSDAEA